MKLLVFVTLVALVILAIFIIVTVELNVAAIVFGTFSAISSLVFLILAAPDVALAQTIIGCTISTIIFLAGIKKYRKHSMYHTEEAVKKRNWRGVVSGGCLLGIVAMVFYSGMETIPISKSTMDEIMKEYLRTGAENAVTATYLDFRILDTLLEAFLLLVSVVGISQFLILEDIERVHMDPKAEEIKRSILTHSVGQILLVLVAIFGIYTIVFGADSPGGGFQGGAVLATIVMIWYLTRSDHSFHFHKLSTIEEVAFFLFVILVGLYFLFYSQLEAYRVIYLLLCAVFVGVKVAIGLAVIFFHFTGGDREIE